MPSYQYRKSHCGDKRILWPSYLHNGISYTGKTTSLYWIRALVTPYDDTDLSQHWLRWCLIAWWHQAITSSRNNTDWSSVRFCGIHDDVIKWKHIPRYWPVTWSFDVFFDLGLIKRLSNQSRGWWFETPSCPLWRHCNDSPEGNLTGYTQDIYPRSILDCLKVIDVRLQLHLPGTNELTATTGYTRMNWHAPIFPFTGSQQGKRAAQTCQI